MDLTRKIIEDSKVIKLLFEEQNEDIDEYEPNEIFYILDISI